MTHRGACGCEANTGACASTDHRNSSRALHITIRSRAPPNSRLRLLVCPAPAGDGAGILVAIPHLFLTEVVQEECGFQLPPQVRPGRLGAAAGGGHCLRANLLPTQLFDLIGRCCRTPRRDNNAHIPLTPRCPPARPPARSLCCTAACCRATTRWARSSCPPTQRSMRRPRACCSRSPPTRATSCWAGAACPPTTGEMLCGGGRNSSAVQGRAVCVPRRWGRQVAEG